MTLDIKKFFQHRFFVPSGHGEVKCKNKIPKPTPRLQNIQMNMHNVFLLGCCVLLLSVGLEDLVKRGSRQAEKV